MKRLVAKTFVYIFTINLFVFFSTLQAYTQDYCNDQAKIDFLRGQDALKQEIPSYVMTHFDIALSEIEKMLTGKIELDFKRAVFLVENSYYEGALDWIEFNYEIDRIKILLNNMIERKGLRGYPTAGNWAIFSYMTDSIIENEYNPYTYDIDNFMNDNNRGCYMVSNLLKTHRGNCRSLPYLYKILANELGVEAFLAIVPMHCYVKHRDNKGVWWNLELTTGSFARSSFIMETFNVSEIAIRSGLYMKGLDEVESIAYCLVDLLSFYEWKTGRYSDGFIRYCYGLGLEYFPVSLLQVWKANDLQFMIGDAILKRDISSNGEILLHPDLYALYLELDSTMGYLKDIGFSTIKQADYIKMVDNIIKEQIRLKE